MECTCTLPSSPHPPSLASMFSLAADACGTRLHACLNSTPIAVRCSLQKFLPIILEYFSILFATYFSQNYASINYPSRPIHGVSGFSLNFWEWFTCTQKNAKVLTLGCQQQLKSVASIVFPITNYQSLGINSLHEYFSPILAQSSGSSLNSWSWAGLL